MGDRLRGSRSADEANIHPLNGLMGAPWLTLPADADSRQVRQSVVDRGMCTTGVAASSATEMKAM